MSIWADLRFLIPILAFLVLNPLPKNSYAQKDLGVPVREPVIKKPFSVTEFYLRFRRMMRDHEILCKIEFKKNEIIFQSQRESEERIRELENELNSLKGRLSSKYFDY
jgi:hypothetical protein